MHSEAQPVSGATAAMPVLAADGTNPARASVNVNVDQSLLSRLASRVGAASYLTVHRAIDLSGTDLTPNDVEFKLSQALASAQAEAGGEVQGCRFRPQPNVIISLRLRDNRRLGDAGTRAVTSALMLRAPLTLRVLSLSGVGVGDSGVTALALALAGATSTVSLVCLDLSDNKLSGTSGSALAQLLAAPKQPLEELRLSRNGLGDSGTTALADGLLANAQLKTLYLGNNEVGATGIAALADALRSHGLVALSIPGNELRGEAGCAAAAGLLQNGRFLQRLWLGESCLGAGAAGALADALAVDTTSPTAPSPRLAALTHLWLQRARLGVSGGEGVARLLCSHSCGLVHLWLGSNGLGDNAAGAIAGALDAAPSLLRLWLEHNEICAKGADALLTAAIATGTLQQLDLQGNLIGEDDVARLLRRATGTGVRLILHPEHALGGIPASAPAADPAAAQRALAAALAIAPAPAPAPAGYGHAEFNYASGAVGDIVRPPTGAMAARPPTGEMARPPTGGERGGAPQQLEPGQPGYGGYEGGSFEGGAWAEVDAAAGAPGPSHVE